MKLENSWGFSWLILFIAQDVMAGTLRQMTTHWLKIKVDISADVSRSMANVRWQFAGYYQTITLKWWRNVEDVKCSIGLANREGMGVKLPSHNSAETETNLQILLLLIPTPPLRFSNLPLDLSKCQLISKCPFGVFKSPEKPTKFLSGFLA